jgi:glycosidase
LLPHHPALYQIDARDWLWRCRGELGNHCTLDQIPDDHLDRLFRLGFDLVYLLGVWQTGLAGEKISRGIADWQPGYRAAVPDLSPDDITGSPFAVTSYEVHEQFGGNDALEVLRSRMRQHGLGLILDFVPNHTGIDHPWVEEHPEYYVTATAAQFARNPAGFREVAVHGQSRFFAYAKDPNSPPWVDTLQLNYANPALQAAMIAELKRIAKQCDGLRCDMSMLILPDVFQNTWGLRMQPFWPSAVEACRQVNPDFLFLAEVYWGLEGVLLSQGMDYVYDKSLLDNLAARRAGDVRQHLSAPFNYQRRMAHFLENHDEARAAAVFPPDEHRAAATITYLSPGMSFFQCGQLEGARIRPSVHLRRRAAEPPDLELADFYNRLLEVRRSRPAALEWCLLSTVAAWPGNDSFRDFIAFAWQSGSSPSLLVLVASNYSDHQSQCYVSLPFTGLSGRSVTLTDALGSDVYERSGDDLVSRGLYLDVPAWKSHAFRIS